MGSPLLWVVAGFVLVLLVGVFYLIFRLFRQGAGQSQSQILSQTIQQRLDQLQNQLRVNLDGNAQLFQQQLSNLTTQVDDRLGHSAKLGMESSKNINDRLDTAAKVFGELQNKLGKLEEANEKIFNVGRDISSLQEILKKPKARGSLGEFFLADLLGEMLPHNRFELQYRFKNNEIVDAVIHIGDSILAIDSKFPLDNFQRLLERDKVEDRIPFKKMFVQDVKKHIDAIAKKYIQPAEGTFDFAFMYIMAENVFYEVITGDEDSSAELTLQEYALKKRIILVSPNSFYAYLAVLMQALRGERLQKNIHQIITQIRQLTIELGKFRSDFDKIGHHLHNLRTSYEASEKHLERYQDRLEKIHEEEIALEGRGEVRLIAK